MGSVFRFKQFEVDQSGCAMKINTDGVLLAAMVTSKAPKQILDIGTGTGVIALMLAQRFPQAQIEAVEIDEQASATAAKNFQSSVFADRLKANPIAIEQYHPSAQFDLIVSNPPFFVNDLKNAEEKKGIARHTNEVFFDELIAKVATILSEDGQFWFVLPIKQAELLVKKGREHGLFEQQMIHLHSDQTKPEFRRIVSIGRKKTELKTEHFYIYEAEKVYTKAYQKLLKDFFLGY
ncbi:tRNA1(Val) (adenine(37)-N6)-methyltransferase [Pedobacter sp. Hv1]|uniref:tRNA1(Val) (adenine(37)-N6)-methyltransferase n=1 Tax=Pedobacter sp. Hv1 TaxID=1740090 RepID=UPI0006D88EC8|nr:methyltransferase [Pedobacter sp. Hv1]KQC02125.1 tRNA methyltransferase [Pedobacter sp. Hv1]